MQELPPIARVPEKFRSDFLRLDMPITAKIIKAIDCHHDSQVFGALNLIDKNHDSISNKEDYFCRHVGHQRIEKMGMREPEIGKNMRIEAEQISKQMRTDEYKQAWKEAKSKLPVEFRNKLKWKN